MSPAGIVLIVAGALALFGGVFWLIGFAVGRGRRVGWIRTTGRWRRFESGLTRAWQVEYTANDGTSHRVFPTMNATTLDPQGEIAVAYDPNRPGRAVIDTFFHRGGALKTIGLAFLAASLVLAALAAMFAMQLG